MTNIAMQSSEAVLGFRLALTIISADNKWIKKQSKNFTRNKKLNRYYAEMCLSTINNKVEYSIFKYKYITETIALLLLLTFILDHVNNCSHSLFQAHKKFWNVSRFETQATFWKSATSSFHCVFSVCPDSIEGSALIHNIYQFTIVVSWD